MNNNDKNEEILEIKKLDMSRLGKIVGGFYGKDWSDEAQEKYINMGIVHTKNKFKRDSYAIMGINGNNNVPISKSLAKKVALSDEPLNKQEYEELKSAIDKAMTMSGSVSKGGNLKGGE